MLPSAPHRRSARILRWSLAIVALPLFLYLTTAGIPQIRSYWRAAEIRSQTQRLRRMYFNETYEDAAAQGAVLVRRFPEASELMSWYQLAATARPFDRDAWVNAEKLAMQRTEDHPGDPWAWFALAGLCRTEETGCNAIAASEKALAIEPTNPDFIWMKASKLVSSVDRAAEALEYIDAHLAGVQNPAELLVVKAQALELLGTQVHPNEEQVAEAFKILEHVRDIDPENFHAHYLPGLFLKSSGSPEKALPLLQRAVALAPGSTIPHRQYWWAFNALDPSEQSRLRPAIVADVEAVLESNESRPWMLTDVAKQYGAMGEIGKQRDLEERILEDYPGGLQEQLIMQNRFDRMAKALHFWDPEGHGTTRQGSPLQSGSEPSEALEETARKELTAEFKKFLWQYVDKPHSANEEWQVAQSYTALFEAFEIDPTGDEDKLPRIVRGLVEHRGYDYGYYQARGILALAERGQALDQAEALARAALSHVAAVLAKAKDKSSDVAWELDFLNESSAGLHDALGWVLSKRGRRAESESELRTAYRLRPGQLENLRHLGILASSRGQRAKAEDFFAECARLPYEGQNPCRVELESLYRARHADMAGFEEYSKHIAEKGIGLYRERLLATRNRTPEVIPEFHLKSLQGAPISSDDLRGKIAVIDFWGVWCQACVHAMPEFQRLVDKYRDDEAVAIVTIDAWDSRTILENWLKKNPHSLTVLLDDGYVDEQQISSFPTTWFLDRQGRLSYVLRGNEGDLVEEDSWLIEDLKHR